MQPIYIDLHIHTSEDANNLNTNYDIAELVGRSNKETKWRQSVYDFVNRPQYY